MVGTLGFREWPGLEKEWAHGREQEHQGLVAEYCREDGSDPASNSGRDVSGTCDYRRCRCPAVLSRPDRSNVST